MLTASVFDERGISCSHWISSHRFIRSFAIFVPMCLAVPAKVLRIEGDIAEVDFGGVVRQANISLVDAKLGGYVIVHAGYAIQTLDREEAEETLEMFKEILGDRDA